MVGSVAGFGPGAALRGAPARARSGCCALALVALACGSADPRASNDSGPGAAGAENSIAPTRVEFALDDLEMAPGEAQELTLTIDPPGEYRVRFALLGDSLDASLDHTEVTSDPDGRCSVGLTAPSNTATASFRIRASIGTETATELPVTIASSGTGMLRVEPAYAGARPVRFWVASAYPATSCAELTGTPPAAAAFTGQADFGDDPRLEVEAGRPLAVTLRGEEKVTGCLEVPPLAVNEQRTVTLQVTDVPLRTASAPLELTFDLSALAPPWSELGAPGAAAVGNALLGPATDDLDALLDAMVEIAETDVLDTDFSLARTSGGWDGALFSHAGTRGGSRLLRDALERWLAVAGERLATETALVGTVQPVSGEDGRAELVPARLRDVSASAAGLPETVAISWRAEPGDRLLLGATIPWDSTRIWLALATDAALVEEPTASSAPDALAEIVDCATLGEDLQSRALGAMGSCDGACTAAVCQLALAALWERASTEYEVVSSTLELSATAEAVVDASARPISCEGTWVGTLSVGELAASGSGSVFGAAPATTPPAE